MIFWINGIGIHSNAMALHSCTRIWIHLIWGTYRKKLVISDLLNDELNATIRSKANQLGIRIFAINIQPDHIHVLLQLPSNVSISIVAKQLKDTSCRLISLYVNGFSDFSWQRGFGAFSVSSSAVDIVKRYIKAQDVQHSRMSFHEEYELWDRMYNKDTHVQRQMQIGFRPAL
ncbi:MAG: IS200/IS605 family transposase [Bacteroidetes bacterium]|nr:IS200/IS605 family transposase [Bacteroidota bacterium]